MSKNKDKFWIFESEHIRKDEKTGRFISKTTVPVAFKEISIREIHKAVDECITVFKKHYPTEFRKRSRVTVDGELKFYSVPAAAFFETTIKNLHKVVDQCVKKCKKSYLATGHKKSEVVVKGVLEFSYSRYF